MNPGQELFGALLAALRKAYPGMVYDSFLPPEETPYPFIYLNGTYEIEDFRMKGVYFGQTAISIDVWHNDPTQRGTVDSLLFFCPADCPGTGSNRQLQLVSFGLHSRVHAGLHDKSAALQGNSFPRIQTLQEEKQ